MEQLITGLLTVAFVSIGVMAFFFPQKFQVLMKVMSGEEAHADGSLDGSDFIDHARKVGALMLGSAAIFTVLVLLHQL